MVLLTIAQENRTGAVTPAATSDTARIVNIIRANKFKLIDQDTNKLNMFVGNVLIQQGKPMEYLHHDHTNTLYQNHWYQKDNYTHYYYLM